MAVTGFPAAARRSLRDSQLRANLARATSTIRDKRGRVVDEVPDWEGLRAAGAAIKDSALLELDRHLTQLESSVQARGGTVHWASDGIEACSIVAEIARAHSLDEVVKVKSIATDEIGLNEQLAASGIHAVETDLAELIIQLDQDFPSHILVPAIHRNRAEIREIFRRELGLDDLTDEPPALTEAARLHLRRKFLSARMGVSGANFAVAETGSVCVFESEGNGRMCTTLPEVLVTVMGIEKVIPSWRDMEVFLQLLPRSSTGERMNPYTSVWSGVAAAGDSAAADGPREFHLVLVDNGRVQTLADEVGRQALRCIRCSACLNVCPVYARVGGHAYGSVYPGPIGAILTPQLVGIEGNGPDRSRSSAPATSSQGAASSGRAASSTGAASSRRAASSPGAASSGRAPSSSGAASSREHAASLPYASSLCGACGEVCPVKIEIPRLLTHLRAREVAARRRLDPEKLTMRALFHTFSTRERYERAQKIARAAARPLARGRATISRAPGPLAGWTMSRELPTPAPETFREWWRRTRGPSPSSGTVSAFYMHDLKKEDIVWTAGRPDASRAAGGGRGTRADILHRIRSALQGATPHGIPRNYRTQDARPRDEIVTLFAERVAEYRATVHRVRKEEVRETVERIAREAGAERIGIPADLPPEWRRGGEVGEASGDAKRAPGGAKRTPGDAKRAPGGAKRTPGDATRPPRGATRPPGQATRAPGAEEGGLQLIEDASLSVQELDALDGALTGCAVAIAEVGAFVLDGGQGQGRRALTLVPDLHICVVREDQVVGLVPEAVKKLEGAVRAGRPLTFVAGPSATSDIELDRVEGVHGPRVLHVLVVAG